jgi:hypothetical protein
MLCTRRQVEKESIKRTRSGGARSGGCFKRAGQLTQSISTRQVAVKHYSIRAAFFCAFKSNLSNQINNLLSVAQGFRGFC